MSSAGTRAHILQADWPPSNSHHDHQPVIMGTMAFHTACLCTSSTSVVEAAAEEDTSGMENICKKSHKTSVN